MKLNPNDTTDQRKAAMQGFGFEAVPLDEPGAPTPSGERRAAGRNANGAAVHGRLRMALEAWEN